MKFSVCTLSRPLSAARPGTMRPALWAGLALAAALAGCSRAPARLPVQPVEGQVLWNGKPLAGAAVVFYPQGWQTDGSTRAPRAQTGSDGKFHIGTYDKGDGAPEGQYLVTVVHFPMVPRGSDVVPGPNVLPKKYASPKTTDLHVQVTKGTNTLPVLALK
ncbi:MAG: hypothetical protein ABSG68_03345 [Thermoguttaceae bacterium]